MEISETRQRKDREREGRAFGDMEKGEQACNEDEGRERERCAGEMGLQQSACGKG